MFTDYRSYLPLLYLLPIKLKVLEIHNNLNANWTLFYIDDIFVFTTDIRPENDLTFWKNIHLWIPINGTERTIEIL